MEDEQKRLAAGDGASVEEPFFNEEAEEEALPVVLEVAAPYSPGLSQVRGVFPTW